MTFTDLTVKQMLIVFNVFSTTPIFYWNNSRDSNKKNNFFGWYHLTLIHFTQMFSIFIQLHNFLITLHRCSGISIFQNQRNGARDTQRIKWGKEVLEEFKGIAHVPSILVDDGCGCLFNSKKRRCKKNDFFPKRKFFNTLAKKEGNVRNRNWIFFGWKFRKSISSHYGCQYSVF